MNRYVSENENTKEDKTTRLHRRAERNKVRALRHVIKLLELYQEGVLRGFSSDGWGELASLYNQLSSHLTLEEYNALGHAWRVTWTQNLDSTSETICPIVREIKSRLTEA